MEIIACDKSSVRQLIGAALGPGRGLRLNHSPKAPVVGVSNLHLTKLQARCLIAAWVFWACALAVALPSILLMGLILVPVWMASEVLFFSWWCFIYRRLNAQPTPHRPPPHEDPRKVFDRFIHDQPALSRYINIVDMVSRWHWGVPASKLTRGNVADLLCYGFFYRSQQQLADEGLGHVPAQLVSELETAWGVTFPDGPYKPLPMMTHLWEPVRCFYRPLFFYAGVEVLIAMKHVMLLAAGFKSYMHAGMRYYTYDLPALGTPSAATAAPANVAGDSNPSSVTDAPILFLHGVGLGILPYLNFLLRLSSLGRPVVAVEVRHLSMRVCATVPEEDEVLGAITGVLARHGVPHVHVVAHSYGTFMASRLVQLQRSMVASLTLLDPVCFVMFSGKLIYNFVYCTPLAGSSLLTWFIARDLAHAVSVCRRFYWSLLNLWPDQLPEHTLVALSARDELVPVPEVMTMLEAHPAIRVLMHPTHRHADFIKDLPWQAKMVQQVAILVAEASAAATATAAATVTAAEAEAEGCGATVAGNLDHPMVAMEALSSGLGSGGGALLDQKGCSIALASSSPRPRCLHLLSQQEEQQQLQHAAPPLHGTKELPAPATHAHAHGRSDSASSYERISELGGGGIVRAAAGRKVQ